MAQPDPTIVPERDVAPAFWAEEVDRAPLARPAALRGRRLDTGPARGRPGPDQGWGYHLLTLVEGELDLVAGEQHQDITAGVAAIAAALAALEGRAPVLADVTRVIDAYHLRGGASSDDLRKRGRFRGVAHDALRRRLLVDATLAELSAVPTAR
ncbi:hypothetical protein Afer_1539 [Acidimicrobium ferrooxidans DSM 10331]|uniref:Uncharacterized protein n=1 Tax=Acidimicrobium ferrooxidans (strain DSM 10331 / JCM 15462 / NBRC 103882 / ICP) TaxID=525909 RepID=C7M0F4_ACIFD|nr:hypothetical protein [Acidimicrobium ferrooxidans]ACU54462.1 hypothetical protein Afer_1539 [Acidimicrobium ferrooxidans DSM 10331]